MHGMVIMRSVIRTNIDRIIVVLLIPMLFGCVPDSGRTFEDGSVISDAELAGVRDLVESRYSELYSADAEVVFCPGDFSLQWEDAKVREGDGYIDYYNSPSSATYMPALSILRSPSGYYYDSTSFPMSENMGYDERIKHIK